MHGWQGESTDGLKGACDFWWLQWSPQQHQLHYNYNYMALRYTTLHPAAVGEVVML